LVDRLEVRERTKIVSQPPCKVGDPPGVVDGPLTTAGFWELYDAFRQDEDLAKDELTEMQVLLDRCPLIDPREAGNPYTETHEERRERQLLEAGLRGSVS
jgi:hypothetical protein